LIKERKGKRDDRKTKLSTPNTSPFSVKTKIIWLATLSKPVIYFFATECTGNKKLSDKILLDS